METLSTSIDIGTGTGIGIELCAGCYSHLTPPYIDCKECPEHGTFICLHCFARGVEFGHHQNDHCYSVVRYDFPLYENHWTAAEELNMLTAMEDLSYGNWEGASIQLKNKSAAECQRHYNKCYVNNPQQPLPKFPEYEPDVVPVPIVFKLSDDPPRPADGSPLYQEMGGYSAPRGDFSTEFNNYAEHDICSITFDEDGHGYLPSDAEEDEEESGYDQEDNELMNEMKMALIYSYHHRLRERHRRKRIVKDHGLINLRKLMWFQQSRLDRAVHQQMSQLQVFTSLLTPFDNDKLQEALVFEQEIKSRICELQEFRTHGLKRLHSVHLYKTLRSRRNISRQRRHLLTDVVSHIRDDAICQSWLQRQSVADGSNRIINLPSAPRRSAPPLKIEGLPGFERLSPSERELCATTRILPEAFLEFSTTLINECNKHCGLRLAQARTLIKMDVNKTRKLYDFLALEGKINKV